MDPPHRIWERKKNTDTFLSGLKDPSMGREGGPPTASFLAVDRPGRKEKGREPSRATYCTMMQRGIEGGKKGRNCGPASFDRKREKGKKKKGVEGLFRTVKNNNVKKKKREARSTQCPSCASGTREKEGTSISRSLVRKK